MRCRFIAAPRGSVGVRRDRPDRRDRVGRSARRASTRRQARSVRSRGEVGTGPDEPDRGHDAEQRNPGRDLPRRCAHRLPNQQQRRRWATSTTSSRSSRPSSPQSTACRARGCSSTNGRRPGSRAGTSTRLPVRSSRCGTRAVSTRSASRRAMRSRSRQRPRPRGRAPPTGTLLRVGGEDDTWVVDGGARRLADSVCDDARRSPLPADRDLLDDIPVAPGERTAAEAGGVRVAGSA